MRKDVIVNKINGSLKVKNISLVEGGYITNYGGCVAIGYKAGNKEILLSVSTEDMQKFLDSQNEAIEQNNYKPVKKPEYGQYSGKCRCGHTVFDCNKFCSDCGAKLDWD